MTTISFSVKRCKSQNSNVLNRNPRNSTKYSRKRKIPAVTRSQSLLIRHFLEGTSSFPHPDLKRNCPEGSKTMADQHSNKPPQTANAGAKGKPREQPKESVVKKRGPGRPRLPRKGASEGGPELSSPTEDNAPATRSDVSVNDIAFEAEQPKQDLEKDSATQRKRRRTTSEDDAPQKRRKTSRTSLAGPSSKKPARARKATPAAGSTRAKPAAGSTRAKLAAGLMRAKPAAGLTRAKPAAGLTRAKPAAAATKAKPAAGVRKAKCNKASQILVVTRRRRKPKVVSSQVVTRSSTAARKRRPKSRPELKDTLGQMVEGKKNPKATGRTSAPLKKPKASVKDYLTRKKRNEKAPALKFVIVPYATRLKRAGTPLVLGPSLPQRKVELRPQVEKKPGFAAVRFESVKDILAAATSYMHRLF